jgi:hypothetical protein
MHWNQTRIDKDIQAEAPCEVEIREPKCPDQRVDRVNLKAVIPEGMNRRVHSVDMVSNELSSDSLLGDLVVSTGFRTTYTTHGRQRVCCGLRQGNLLLMGFLRQGLGAWRDGEARLAPGEPRPPGA